MSSFDPQLAMLAAITSAIVYTMIAAGIAKKQLRWRGPRRCPICGGTPCHCRLTL